MIIKGNFFEISKILFYMFISAAQTLYELLTYNFDLYIAGIDLGIVEIPLGINLTIYPSMIFGTQIFITLFGLRLIKKFVPLA